MAQIAAIEDIFLALLRRNNQKENVNLRLRSFRPSDWQELCEFAVDSGLFPVFYSRLLNLNSKDLPSELLSQAKSRYLVNLKRNLILEQELLKVLTCFRELNIPIVPLKGPVLARYLYGDLALRQASCDLDLLVEDGRLPEAERILEENGYRSCYSNEDAFRRNFGLKYSRQLKFIRESELGNFFVELHVDVRGLFTYAPLEDFWKNLKEVDFDGTKILMPSKESLLIYLALVTMTISEFIEPRYLYDVNMLVSKFNDELDWEGIVSKVQHTRHKACLFFTLDLAKAFLDLDMPKGLLDRIKPNPIKRLLLRPWINKRNILYARRNTRSWYWHFSGWYYFATSYLYANNIFDCIRIIYKKIFLPAHDMAGLYGESTPTAAHWLYLKRILKPLNYAFKLR